MSRNYVYMILVLTLVAVHTSARNVQNETTLHVNNKGASSAAPMAADRKQGAEAGLKDDKTFVVFGGLGGFGGIGGAAGIVGLPGLGALPTGDNPPAAGGSGGTGGMGGKVDAGGAGGTGGCAVNPAVSPAGSVLPLPRSGFA